MSATLYETFCDGSYYDLWCVRKVGERRWGYCYHMNSEEEAKGLVKQLTELERELAKAKKDSARLDSRTIRLTCPDGWGNGWVVYEHVDLRAAIDAAMAEPK